MLLRPASFVAIAALSGCGALVGVKELEVEATEPIDTPDASRADAGSLPVDAGGDADGGTPSLPPQARPPMYTYAIRGGDHLTGAFTSARRAASSPASFARSISSTRSASAPCAIPKTST